MDHTATLNYYYANNGQRLRLIVDGALTEFGGIYDKDKDDFYSLANIVFLSALKSYRDGRMSFRVYLGKCISNRVKTEMSKRNAKKRSAEVMSLDDEENFWDVPDESSIEEEFLSEESARKLYNSLTRTGKQIVALRLQGKTDSEIKKELGLNNKEFASELTKAQMSVVKHRQ